jgi:hypothetical protein
MDRVKLLEIHEQSWFPASLRDHITDALQFVFGAARVYEPVAPRLAEAADACNASRFVDLCSGAGGPWISLHRALAPGMRCRPEIVLTDKFPNLGAFEDARKISGGALDYSADPIDAAGIPAPLIGFRTIFSSFHHFEPEEAAAILREAVEQRQGIGIFEAARRTPAAALGALLMPVAALLLVPFMRPFRFSRLVWTYLIPVIPFVLLFDGVLSCLRAYSPDELAALASRCHASDYAWSAGVLPGPLIPVAYLLGYPRATEAVDSLSEYASVAETA